MSVNYATATIYGTGANPKDVIFSLLEQLEIKGPLYRTLKSKVIPSIGLS